MAAIPIPYTFVTGTIIDPDQMNANFQSIASNAASDVGGVLDSPTLNNATVSGDLLFSPDATVDIGKSGASRPRDLFLARNAMVGGTLTVNGLSAITSATNPVLAVNATSLGYLVVRGNTSVDQVYLGAPSILFGLGAVTDGALVAPAHLYLGSQSQGGTGSVRFVTANTEKMRLHTSGGLSLGNIADPGAGILSVTGQGIHAFAGATNAYQIVQCQTTSTGTAARALFRTSAGGVTGDLSSYAEGYTASGANLPWSTQLQSDGGNGLSLVAVHVSGPIRFYSGGVTERMRLHASGGLSLGNVVDPGAGALRVTGLLTVGTITVNAGNLAVTAGNVSISGTLAVTGVTTISNALNVSGVVTVAALIVTGSGIFLGSNVTDSTNTPIITGGFGTSPSIIGKVYAFRITIGTGPSTGGTIDFGFSFPSIPICVASISNNTSYQVQISASTTQLSFLYTAGAAGQVIDVLVRGY